ncbi:Palmitoyltransferase zdhhc13 [Clydaea vesicula]|uniref:Palmitoyltransferase n=1 Tax=Clydaea vesicula TaxID=447962 RepID=A0AAD5UA81_9FUNG|nr:Palmitoyltransferase zdhhc13 [Clydaea vesicula]
MLKSLFGHKHSHDDKCRHGKEESMFDDGTKSDNNDDCETIPLTHSLEQENINNLDLFQLAQRGLKEDFIFELQRSGNNPDLLDNEACSSLHWAAINNRIEVALYLISVKATVDIRGGQLSATPLHWAARAGHIHMVTILLKNGADPTLFDGQGYNALHLAAHAGHHLLMLYLNAIGMDWNTPDSASRTCLHWVAYQGNSLDSLKSLLKHNVGLDFLDNSGYTALHWSVIANHLDFSYELVKAGCNIDVKDGQGKTALDWAKERNTDEKFQKMLNDYYKETIKNNWYISFPVSLAVLSLIHNYIFMGYLLGNGQIKPVHTPYLTSIPQATIFYCVLDWMTMINDSGMMIENILMCILSAVLIYSFYKSVVLNPGYLKLNLSQTEKQAVIIRLAENGNLDARHYCLTCEVGKPLRSKHCKICDKCVAKFDQ